MTVSPDTPRTSSGAVGLGYHFLAPGVWSATLEGPLLSSALDAADYGGADTVHTLAYRGRRLDPEEEATAIVFIDLIRMGQDLGVRMPEEDAAQQAEAHPEAKHTKPKC